MSGEHPLLQSSINSALPLVTQDSQIKAGMPKLIAHCSPNSLTSDNQTDWFAKSCSSLQGQLGSPPATG
jgi:hypothetical protein